MKTIAATDTFRYSAVLVFLVGILSIAHAEKGVVAKTSTCDYFIIATKKGFTVAESYGTPDPEEGDIIYGSFQSYGFKDYRNESQDDESRLYIEDYQLEAEEAVSLMWEQCD